MRNARTQRRAPPAALIAVCGLLATVALSGPLGAQSVRNKWSEQVVEMLRGNRAVMEQLTDYQASHEPVVNRTSQGGVHWVDYDLERGSTYAFAGVCDEDCGDIDLRLYGPDGIIVASDTGPDDEPVVTIRANKSGRYRLKLSMEHCVDDPCWWGVNSYHR